MSFKFSNCACSSSPCAGCYLCVAGEYNDSGTQPTKGSPCKLCPQGTYSAKVGATSLTDCQSCPTGKFGFILGADNLDKCYDCAPGKYIDEEGTHNCKICPFGYYAKSGQSIFQQMMLN